MISPQPEPFMNGIPVTCILLACSAIASPAKPLKVFILAGQSNMEGPADVSTFDAIGDDPDASPLLEAMRGPDGNPRVCDGAWISYLTGDGDRDFVLNGRLTAGYGSMWGTDPSRPGNKIGPEFVFGLAMDASFQEPVLLIKAAWGGKSLHTDFRPPSAGPYELSAFQAEHYPKQQGHGIPEDFEQWKSDKVVATGHHYRLMMNHVKSVLADPKSVVPEYRETHGYELSGFIWLQGFNDMVDSHVYPQRDSPDPFAVYTGLLCHLIRDVRSDLNAPKMPVVIGVMGVGGTRETSRDVLAFRKAMAAPASLPEFQGNVAAVETAPFWSDELGAIDAKREKIRQMRHFLDSKHADHPNAEGLMTEEQIEARLERFERELIHPAETELWNRGASDAGYHYLGSAKTFALMGRAFARANLTMLEGR